MPKKDTNEQDKENNARQAGGHSSIAGGSYKITKNPTEEQWQEAEKTFKKSFSASFGDPAGRNTVGPSSGIWQ